MVLVRFALICLIVYLIIKSFFRFGEENGSSPHRSEPEKEKKSTKKSVPKTIGEYVDYEEVNKKN
jgi:hypothetical protein